MLGKRIGIVTLGDSGAACTVFDGSWGRVRTVESFAVQVDASSGYGPLPDMDTLAAELKRLQCQRIVIGLPLFQLIIERIDLPAMKRVDLEQALPFEVERHLPLPLGEFAWGYDRIPGAGKNLRCLVAAVRRQWTDRIRQQCEEAGILLLGFRINHLERAKALASKIREGLIVSVGNTEIEWAELRGGRISGLRYTAIPPNADILGIVERGLPAPGPEAAPGTVVFLAKDRATLASGLHERSGRKTEAAEVDTGLAVGQGHLRRRHPDILLAPTIVDEGATFHRNLTAGLLAGALVLSVLSGQARTWKEEAALESLKGEIAELKTRLREGQEGVDGYSVVSALKIIREFSAGRNHPTAALGELARRLPEDTWLHSFDMNEKGKIEISGFAEDSAMLVEALADSPAFSSVQWKGTVQRDGTGRFSLSMQWRGTAR